MSSPSPFTRQQLLGRQALPISDGLVISLQPGERPAFCSEHHKQVSTVNVRIQKHYGEEGVLDTSNYDSSKYEDAEKERIAAAKLARSQELQRRAQVRLAQHREQLKADKEAQAAREAAERAKRDQLKSFNQRVTAANLGRNASAAQVLQVSPADDQGLDVTLRPHVYKESPPQCASRRPRTPLAAQPYGYQQHHHHQGGSTPVSPSVWVASPPEKAGGSKQQDSSELLDVTFSPQGTGTLAAPDSDSGRGSDGGTPDSSVEKQHRRSSGAGGTHSSSASPSPGSTIGGSTEVSLRPSAHVSVTPAPDLRPAQGTALGAGGTASGTTGATAADTSGPANLESTFAAWKAVARDHQGQHGHQGRQQQGQGDVDQADASSGAQNSGGSSLAGSFGGWGGAAQPQSQPQPQHQQQQGNQQQPQRLPQGPDGARLRLLSHAGPAAAAAAMQRATAAVMGEDQDEEGWGSQGSGEHSDVGQGGIQELESYRQSHQQPQQQQCQQGPKVVRIFRRPRSGPAFGPQHSHGGAPSGGSNGSGPGPQRTLWRGHVVPKTVDLLDTAGLVVLQKKAEAMGVHLPPLCACDTRVSVFDPRWTSRCTRNCPLHGRPDLHEDLLTQQLKTSKVL